MCWQVHIGYGTLLVNVAVHVREVGEEAVGGAAVVRAAISGAAEFLHTGTSSCCPASASPPCTNPPYPKAESSWLRLTGERRHARSRGGKRQRRRSVPCVGGRRDHLPGSACVQRARERARGDHGGGWDGDNAQQPKSSRVRSAAVRCLHVTRKLAPSTVAERGTSLDRPP